jgi:hypothetical protein
VQFEADVANGLARRDPGRLEHGLAGSVVSGFDERGGVALRLADVATEHLRHQLELADLRHCCGAHRAAVAHDGDAVADLVELVELVRDEDHRDAVRLQLPDDRKQNLDLLLVERGGRFVHDHEPRRKADGPRDRDHLLRCGGEF